MGFESFFKKPAEEKMQSEEDVMDTLNRLRLIRNSLELEQESKKEAEQDAGYYERQLESTRKSSINESIYSGNVSESNKVSLVKNQTLMEEAKSFVDDMDNLSTSHYPYGAHAYPPELKDALESVGINVSGSDKRLDQLLNERENELRLEIPGGLEEMIGEFIRENDLLDKASKLFKYVDDLPAQEMYDLLKASGIDKYPVQVRAGVIGYLTQECFKSGRLRGRARLEEGEEAAEKMVEMVSKLF